MPSPSAKAPSKVVTARPDPRSRDRRPPQEAVRPRPDGAPSERTRALVTFVLLALAVALAYARAVPTPFIFDDLPGIVDNPSITRLWPPIGEAGNRGPLNPPPLAPTSRRPLVNLSFALDHHFHGLEPAGYHVVNLVAHLLAVVMLAALVRRTLLLPYFSGISDDAAWLLSLSVAMLWAVHPLNSESVAYVTQRTELFAGLAYLTILYSALRYWTAAAHASRRRWAALAAVSSLAGIASKEIVVSAPIAVLLFEVTFFRRSWRDALRSSWPLYAGLALGWVLLVLLNASGVGGLSDPRHYVPIHVWWMTQAKVLFLYLKLSVWPWPLSIHYAPAYLRTMGDGLPWVAAAAVAVAAIAALVWRRPAARFVVAVATMVLAPTFVIPLPKMLAAERRMYLALAGLIALALVGGYRLLRARAPGIGASLPLAGVALLIAVAGLVTYRRLAAYESPVTIWQDSLLHQPDDPMARNNLGVALADAGRTEEAIGYFEEALALDPAHVGALGNLGTVLSDLGRADEARAKFEAALAIEPNDTVVRNNLGAVLTRLGRPEEALPHLERALSLEPDEPKFKVHSNLGNALLDLGRSREALEHLNEAVRLRPGDAGTHYGLGAALVRIGRPAEAIAPLEEARRLGRRDAEAHNLYASALLATGRSEEAVREYGLALDLEPDYAEAHNNLATALLQMQRTGEAIPHLEEALRLEPDYVSARFNLANALANSGREGEAIVQFDEVLRLAPDDAQARFAAALAHARVGEGERARTMAQAALVLARSQGDVALAGEISTWLGASGR